MASAAQHSEQTTLPTAAPRGAFSFSQWLWRAVPTAIVVVALSALAAWGRLNDWKLPKFSALIGTEATELIEWCQAHNVPEADCIECNLTLLPASKDFGWCKDHGVAQCPLEHPEVAQLKTLPTITQAVLNRASRALSVKPRAENNSLCRLHLKRIQFASTEAVEKAGVDIAVVQERPIVEAAVANGEVTYDQTRMAHLSSRVSGTVWQVERQVGDRVHKGDCLALVDAADVGKAKAELLHAMAQVRLKQTTMERLKPLGEGAISIRQLREAEAALQEARISLQSARQSLINLGLPAPAEELGDVDLNQLARQIHFLGLPPDVAARLDANSTTSNLFPIRAPLDGMIIERHAVAGEIVDTTRPLFAVADNSRLWLMLNVREEDAEYVSPAQAVLFRPNSGTGPHEIRGEVAWISTSIDDQTRTVKVRVELPNAEGRLRSGTFGTGRIVLREEDKAVVVPSEAVHWDGSCHVVFVRDKNYHDEHSPKFFHVRSVRPGVKDGELTEIIAGLLPGEVIASKNSVVLEAQLLKSNLGAGCGCADGH